MSSALRVAVFGEALVDIARSGRGEVVRPGGSPLNVAVGLARLGADVEFATSVGQDAYGEVVLAHLAGAGVSLSPGSVQQHRTSVAEADLGTDGSATYRFDLAWDPTAWPSRSATVGHIGSISAVLQPGAERVLQWAASLRNEAVVSFDPNVRPSITGGGPALRDAIERAVAVSDIVKLSSEDLEVLGDPGLPDVWLGRGAALVIVTEGERGARLTSAGGTVLIPTRSVRVADTIGAGDSFMAGLLWSLGAAGLLERRALREASIDELSHHVTFAMRCAAITVGREGADPPTLQELDHGAE